MLWLSVLSSAFFPIYEAARQGHRDVIELLVAKDARVDAKTLDGQTPLQIALFYGNLDASKVLVDYGADINIKDKHGLTPLHHAAKDGYMDVAKLMVTWSTIPCGSPRCKSCSIVRSRSSIMALVSWGGGQRSQQPCRCLFAVGQMFQALFVLAGQTQIGDLPARAIGVSKRIVLPVLLRLNPGDLFDRRSGKADAAVVMDLFLGGHVEGRDHDIFNDPP